MPKTTDDESDHTFIGTWLLAWGDQPHINITFEPDMHLVVPVSEHFHWWYDCLTLKPVNPNDLVPLMHLLLFHSLDSIVAESTCNYGPCCSTEWRIIERSLWKSCNKIVNHSIREYLLIKAFRPAILERNKLTTNCKDTHKNEALSKPFEACHQRVWDVFVLVSAFNKFLIVSKLKEDSNSSWVAVERVACNLNKRREILYRLFDLVLSQIFRVSRSISVIPSKRLEF